MQLRDLRAYCAARQLTIAREYIDAGQSGTKDSRPQLNELMDDARKRKLDTVLCWRFDRLAWSTRFAAVRIAKNKTTESRKAFVIAPRKEKTPRQYKSIEPNSCVPSGYHSTLTRYRTTPCDGTMAVMVPPVFFISPVHRLRVE